MDIVQIVGIVFVAVVVLALGYLYRESALIEGKAEWGIGPVKFKLSGAAQKAAPEPGEAETPAAKIVQTAEDGAILNSPPQVHGEGEIVQTARQKGIIEGSAPQIDGRTGEIEQTASGGGTISGSAPKIS